MPKLSIRISDEESQKIMRQKGDKTISNYIRELVQKDGEQDSGIEKYLKRVLYESTMSNIAIEELAERLIPRSDNRENFKDSIKKRMEDHKKTGGNTK